MGEKVRSTGFSSQELRKQALARLQKRHGKIVDMPVRSVEALINELEVYQVELEVQNEDLRRTQTELDVALKRYQDLYDRAPVGYLTLDMNGKILQANQAAAQLCFREAHELEGQWLEKLIVLADRDKLWKLQRSATATGLPQAGRFRIVRSAGAPRCVHADISVVEGARGFRLTLSDITPLVQTQDELRDSEQMLSNRTVELEAANRELEAFSYSVSHDLRAPLRTMGGFSDLLLEESSEKLGPEIRKHLQRIRNGAEIMSRLIDDLLRLSRLSRQEIERTDIDLSELAKSIMITLRQTYAKNVEMVVRPGSRVSADANLMRIVLTNLLDNAFKFTRDTENARIEFGFIEQEGKSIYFVKDNGAGFNQQQHADRMFRPFQRLHTETEFEGTGIGLAIVDRIIRRHGGTIRAEGEVGKGATIYFTLG